MKKNVKIARSLLKLAKEPVAVTQFEQAVPDDKALAVYKSLEDYNGNCEAMIESLRLFAVVRKEFHENSSGMNAALEAFLKNRRDLGYSEQRLQTFSANIKKYPIMEQSAQYMLTDSEMAKAYPELPVITDKATDIITAIEAIIMPELQAFQNAVQLSLLAKELCNMNNLHKILGIKESVYNKLVNGVIPEFNNAMQKYGIDYLVKKSQGTEYSNIHSMMLDEYDKKMTEGQNLRARLGQYFKLWGLNEEQAVALDNYLIKAGVINPEKISDDELKSAVKQELDKMTKKLQGMNKKSEEAKELAIKIKEGKDLLKNATRAMENASKNMKVAIVLLGKQEDKFLAPAISYTSMMSARLIPNVIQYRKNNGLDEIPLPPGKSRKSSVKNAGKVADFIEKVVDVSKRMLNKLVDIVKGMTTSKEKIVASANEASDSLQELINILKAK